MNNKANELNQYELDELLFGIEQEVYDMNRRELTKWALRGMTDYYLSMSKAELIESGWITEEESYDEAKV
jgi:hypothetical protein